jgi:hypothetical protein
MGSTTASGDLWRLRRDFTSSLDFSIPSGVQAGDYLAFKPHDDPRVPSLLVHVPKLPEANQRIGIHSCVYLPDLGAPGVHQLRKIDVPQATTLNALLAGFNGHDALKCAANPTACSGRTRRAHHRPLVCAQLYW